MTEVVEHTEHESWEPRAAQNTSPCEGCAQRAYNDVWQQSVTGQLDELTRNVQWLVTQLNGVFQAAASMGGFGGKMLQRMVGVSNDGNAAAESTE